MKTKIISISGFDLLAATIKNNMQAVSQSEFEADYRVENSPSNGNNATRITVGSTAVIGDYDRMVLAKGRIRNAGIVNRAMGILHVNCIVTAAPDWFRRAGVSYYLSTTNDDGTITAAVSMSYFKISGLYHDDTIPETDNEWDTFFCEMEKIPMFDLLIAMDSPEYEELEY